MERIVNVIFQGSPATSFHHHRDTYVWLEAYRLLENNLGEPGAESNSCTGTRLMDWESWT
ncbi:MAG: hypothetical protein WD733_10830 [Bryobacterales bacterium]